MDNQLTALALLFTLGFTMLMDLIIFILNGIGYAAIFHKAGKKRILAFIPAVREYTLALIAEREDEGRTYCILYGCTYLISLLSGFLSDSGPLTKALGIARIAIALAVFLYSIRILTGLCRVFEKSRLWILLWLIPLPIASLIWGLDKKFQPIKHESTDDYSAAAKISGATADEIRHGLTVNITERTATEFFRRKVLLQDIHLAIPTGHMVLLLGGSGAGKTTFLNAVTGYEKAKAEIKLNGQDVYQNYEQMKYDIGFVPQADLMRGCDTVQMTLKDSARLRMPTSYKRKARTERIQEVMDVFGLGSVKNNLADKLSGGQRKRLSICMEFISDPTLFILDEPDSGLDGVVARTLFEHLRSIADSGKIVIVITHTPDRVADLFDDVIVLAKDANRTGRLAYYGPIEEAYTFFGKKSIEEILLSINQKDEGGEGRADEFVESYGRLVAQKAG